jgi:hypothetical protein
VTLIVKLLTVPNTLRVNLVQLTLVLDLELQNSPRIFGKKFKMALVELSSARGKMICEKKNLKSKIS